ncbi:P-loop containing nucleoside triphosphate hydrolase protein [Sistotremastrum suecicum HHB10207 ss-3]|uniref:RNA helicase n=1 Tax=Sistotremastrum suecicum HHB10207 ss-3 TaxID=1314776 RepID=A0A166HCN1_9AGAM|nr:P-loop containing nucleoside triphosphate hydrolase protein [Sistotremastrum suecicum HHB10207 ss-3]
MARKKKTQLKPVVRGFATTSTPSKSATKEESETVSAPANAENEGAQSTSDANQADALNSNAPGLSEEDNFLQGLVDKWQDRTEREIARLIKTIEYDRRLSETLPTVEVDRTLRDQIIELSVTNKATISPEYNNQGSEEKLLPKLAITYGALCRLGFQEALVEDCLQKVHSIEFSDAFHWMCLHCPEEDLEKLSKSDIDSPDSHFTRVAELPGPFSTSISHETVYGVQSEVRAAASPLGQSENGSFTPRRPASRTNGTNPPLDTPAEASKLDEARNPSREADKSRSPTPALDVFDLDSDNESGIFGQLLDEMPTTETDQNGTLVTVRDMGTSKHWNGRLPKLLCAEVVKKIDKYAVLSYHALSVSRAKRAGLEIIWSGGRTERFKMIQVGCHDDIQAEQYIATVALHTLTRGTIGGIKEGNGADFLGTQYRQLPASYRDLWDELEAARVEDQNTKNRLTWAKFRRILESRVYLQPKATARNGKGASDKHTPQKANISIHYPETMSEQIRWEFHNRQASDLYQAMLEQRNRLPIAQYRAEILETMRLNQVFVLSGETGCGKSTQVPAFILEDQLGSGVPCKVYCTEPRRISALSLAHRVSQELGESTTSLGSSGGLVGYAIRLENTISRNTRLAYVTNGIALRMLEKDSSMGSSAFDEITHIIIDEVHERTIESDFLLLLLRKLMEERKDLKIILMSATVEAEKVASYFGGCPILRIPGRTFPVEVRYLEDVLEMTGWSIDEASPLAVRDNYRLARQTKAKLGVKDQHALDPALDDDDDGYTMLGERNLKKQYSAQTISTIRLLDERQIPYELIVRLLECLCFEDLNLQQHSGAILIFLPGLGEIKHLNDLLMEHAMFGEEQLFRVYPLHSTISNENQGAVFDIPPLGIRKIVIATNIAETGITIPDITSVIDVGKHREMRFDEKRQISRLTESFIAKSNASQRRGRAGRVQAGVCFCLFTEERHAQMPEYPLPEIMRLSLADLALRIKIMKVELGDSIEHVLSQALDPPNPLNVQRAVNSLIEAKALTAKEEITPMGRLLSKLPTDVHLGKFLLIATIFKCLDPALTIAAVLNSKSPFVTPFGMESEAENAKRSFESDDSDFLTISNAFSAWRRVSQNQSGSFTRKFCKTSFLSHQNLQQIEELRQQFLGYLIDSSFIKADTQYIRELNKLRHGRHRNKFVVVPQALDNNTEKAGILEAVLAAAFYPKLLHIDRQSGVLRTVGTNQIASFHPSSVNFGKRADSFARDYLCYFTIMHSKKLYAWETSPIHELALLIFCGEADFKAYSKTLVLDHKLKFRLDPKTITAVIILREQMNAVINSHMRDMSLSEGLSQWLDVGLAVFSRRIGSSTVQ